MTNYHTHCHYCDGKGPPLDYVRAALAQGLSALGFSSHAPVPFASDWNMAPDDLPRYLAQVRALRDAYAGTLPVFVGLETDFVPGRVSYPPERARALGLDYTIGSVHFVDAFADGRPWEIDGTHALFLRGLTEIFDGDVRAAVRRYYALTRQMVRQAPPDVVGHLDKIKMHNRVGAHFDTAAGWYREEADETLRTIAGQGLVVEVNSRGLYKKKTADPYPGPWEVGRMAELNVPVTVSADAHHPDELTRGFDQVVALLRRAGHRYVWTLGAGGWRAETIDRWPAG